MALGPTFFGKIKLDVFISLSANDTQDAKLQEIANALTKSNGGINLDLIVDYFEQNSAELTRYFGN